MSASTSRSTRLDQRFSAIQLFAAEYSSASTDARPTTKDDRLVSSREPGPTIDASVQARTPARASKTLVTRRPVVGSSWTIRSVVPVSWCPAYLNRCPRRVPA